MKFCIIDASNLVHRAKHGVLKSSQFNQPIYLGPMDDDEDDPMDDQDLIKKGIILQAVFKSLRKAFEKFNSDHAVVCFDGRSWRKDYYPEYKKGAGRTAKTPSEIKDEELVHDVIDSFMDFCQKYTNVTVLYSQGVEADDFISRWVQLHDDPIFEHVIISRDSDFRQLVRPGVELFAPHENILYTVDGVYYQDGKRAKKDDVEVELYDETWKVRLDKEGKPVAYDPEWELFFKCIRGDSNDNIKSAYPKVRETAMRKAFYGSVQDWNNFINETWGPDENKKSVKERYEFNKTLIDLTAQPEEIVDLMDSIIEEQIDKKQKRMIGAYFGKFCIQFGLDDLQPQAGYFTQILSRRYPLSE